MPRNPFVACAFAGLALCACRAPTADRPADAKYETIRPEWRGTEVNTSREWLSFSTGYVARIDSSDDFLDDGVALNLDGGFDLASKVLTPAIELGIGYTSAHVSDSGADVNSIDIWRASVGMRGTWYLPSWRPYVRGGGFLRWSTDDVDEPLDPYAPGLYVGVGADWPYAGMLLGPSVTYYRALGEDAPGGDSKELQFALSATFRL